MKSILTLTIYFLSKNIVLLILLGMFTGFYVGDLMSSNIKGYELLIVLVLIVGIKVLKVNFDSKFLRVIFVLIISTVLSILYYQKYYDLNFANKAKYYNEEVNVIAVVDSDSVLDSDRTQVIVKTPLYGLIQISLPGYFKFNVGDRVMITGTLEKPPSFEGFDYARYLEIQKIKYVLTNAKIERLNYREESIFSAIDRLRDKLCEPLYKLFPEPHSTLMMGMAWGNVWVEQDELDEKMQFTGTSHIAVVSGFNIALIIGWTESLFKVLPRRLAMLAMLIIVLTYGLIVGLNNLPALRAVLMSVSTIALKFIGKRSNILIILPFIVILLLLENPLIYRSISLHLTISALLGIGCVTPIVEKMFNFLPAFVKEVLSTTLAASLTTMPIILFNFGSMSVGSLIVNVFVSPLVPIITVGGIVISILGTFSLGLSELLATLVWPLINTVVGTIYYFADLEWVFFENMAVSVIELLIFYFVLLFILIRTELIKLSNSFAQ